MPFPSDPYARLNGTVLALVVVGLTYMLVLPWLLAIAPGLLPVCPSRAWLGIPCPLCGLTRGVGLVLRGRVTAALALNPLSLMTCVGMIAEAIYRAAVLASVLPSAAMRSARRIDAAIHGVLLAAYLVYALTVIIST